MSDDPNGLGIDLDCLEDLQPDLRTTSGRTMLAQALVRRIITPRGTLIGDEEYGTDITEMVNDDMSAGDIAALNSAVEAEWQKDERVLDASVTSVLSRQGILTIVGVITDQKGPFSLTLAVSQLTIDLLAVSQ